MVAVRASTMVPARSPASRAAHRRPHGPSLRTTVIASAAAVGAVATGTYDAPARGRPRRPTAVADEAPALGSLSASSMAMLHNPGTRRRWARWPRSDGFAAADQHLASLGKATDIAARIADGPPGAGPARRARGPGRARRWIAQALQVLDLPQNLAPGVKKIIMAESGGNPRAINLTDSNARRGTPSQGLMQTIPSTFRHYVAPEVANRPITDPVANITAGVNYMVENYGINTLAAGGRSNAAGSYIGY